MSTPLQNPAQTLLANIGSFWAQTFQKDYQLNAIVNATLEENEQTILDMANAVAAVSRFEIPIFKRELWKRITIDEETLYRINEQPYLYGDTGITYNGGIVYGQTRKYGKWRIPLPDKVVDVAAILDRPVDPSVIWFKDVDYTINLEDGYIECNSNPFDVGFVIKADFDSAGNEAKVVGMWLHNSDLDLQYVYNQFGYVVGLYADRSSENYKNLVNAVFDTLMKGSNSLSFRSAISSLFGIGIATTTGEVVQSVTIGYDDVTIKTSYNGVSKSYVFPPTSTPVVSNGDVLQAGDVLTNDMEIYEGNTLIDADISALVVEPNFFSPTLRGALVFDNEYHSTTYSVDSDGFVIVTFPIGGNTDDVNEFWGSVYQFTKQPNRVSIAQALRTNNYIGQPQLQEVATSVNPMRFVIDNFLRDNLVIINLKVYNSALIENAKNLLFIRRLLPAHIAILFNIDIVLDDEEVPMGSDNYDSDNQWPNGGANFFYLADYGSFNWNESFNSSIMEIVELVVIA